MDKATKRFMNAKRRAGTKQYPHGVQVFIPQGEGDPIKLTFNGSFDRRKLRKMLRQTFVTPMTTQQIDWIIDNLTVKLRPVNAEEMNALLKSLSEEE